MHKVSILYSWFIRSITYFLPNLPIIMRFRGFLYSLMMKECGTNFQVVANATLNSLSGLTFGKNVYLGPNSLIIGENIFISDEVLIGPNCVIVSGNHTLQNGSFRFGSGLNSGTIKISKGSWLAANCVVLKDSILPEGSILAANSVLNQSYRENFALYAGSPAKYIKKIKVE